MKQLLALLAFVFSLGLAHSQTTLSFCAKVEQNGQCVFNNTRFFLSPDSTSEKIYMKASEPKTFAGTSKIIFRVFSIAKNGTESADGSAEQIVENDWIYAWTPHRFKAGKYRVDIYNDKNELLASRSLELFN